MLQGLPLRNQYLKAASSASGPLAVLEWVRPSAVEVAPPVSLWPSKTDLNASSDHECEGEGVIRSCSYSKACIVHIGVVFEFVLCITFI